MLQHERRRQQQQRRLLQPHHLEGAKEREEGGGGLSKNSYWANGYTNVQSALRPSHGGWKLRHPQHEGNSKHSLNIYVYVFVYIHTFMSACTRTHTDFQPKITSVIVRALGFGRKDQWFAPCRYTNIILKIESFWKLTQFSQRTWDSFVEVKTEEMYNTVLTVFLRYYEIRTQNSYTTRVAHYSLSHRGNENSLNQHRILCIYCRLHRAILLQWKWMKLNEHHSTLFSRPFFLSFFLGLRRPNLIIELSRCSTRWRTSD